MPTLEPSSLASLPLDEQLQALEAALARGESPRALVVACAALRDHAPLAWLCRALLERGLLAGPEPQQWLAELLPLFSSRLIRSRGTLGGNLDQAARPATRARASTMALTT